MDSTTPAIFTANKRPGPVFYDPVRQDVRLPAPKPGRRSGPSICPVCLKVFDRPSGVETHLVTHTGEQRMYLVLAGPHVSYLTSSDIFLLHYSIPVQLVFEQIQHQIESTTARGKQLPRQTTTSRNSECDQPSIKYSSLTCIQQDALPPSLPSKLRGGAETSGESSSPSSLHASARIMRLITASSVLHQLPASFASAKQPLQ
jgi:hypothetical protein